MQRATAVKKLTKMLGNSFAYRVSETAPTPEERLHARDALPAAIKRRNELRELAAARREALLAADPEYRNLQAALQGARELSDRLSGMVHHYRITVGTANSLFFSVRAQGDSWEEIFEKLATKEKAHG